VDNIHLLLHNVVCIGSAISTFGIGLFTYLSGPKKQSNIAWTLMMLMITLFTVSHVIGVNIIDPDVSKLVLMFNVCVFLICAFNAHAIFAMVGKPGEYRRMTIFIYLASVAFVVIFLVFPDLFLLPSVPKMYFPNYYNPGMFNWIRVAYMFVVIIPYLVYVLYKAYKKAATVIEQRQYKYFIITMVIGYATAFIPNLLVYNIQVDPLIGMTFAMIFAVPFVYGAVQYKLFNIEVIAKQAFWYAIAVAIAGALITLFNYFVSILSKSFPSFPIWSVSLGSAAIAVTLAVVIWRYLRQTDILKYEFITTATHKFRTPLTHVRWATENLLQSSLSDDQKIQVRYIESANGKLVELTNLLMNVSEAEYDGYQYSMTKADVSDIVRESLVALSPQYKAKGITLSEKIEPDCTVMCDTSRIKFVIQTFVENAIQYTPDNATMTVGIEKAGNDILFSVKDSGIGIAKEEIELLFSKFYRGHQARITDTEGMGIGLFISKEIIVRHGGRIWAASDGPGKGSTFSFVIPAVK
jgi:signal transduction histidine kinase